MSKKTLSLSAFALLIQWAVAVAQPSFTTEHMAKAPEQSNLMKMVTLMGMIDLDGFHYEHLEKLNVREDQIELLINEYAELIDSMYAHRVHPLAPFTPDSGSLLESISNQEYFVGKTIGISESRSSDDEGDEQDLMGDKQDDGEEAKDKGVKDKIECRIPDSFRSRDELRNFFLHDDSCSLSELYSYLRQSNDSDLIEMSEEVWIDLIKLLVGDTKESISLRLMLSSGQDNLVEKALTTLEGESFTVIGLASSDADFSEHIRKIAEKHSQKLDVFFVILNERMLKNGRLLASLDGIIMPDGEDSFHTAPNYLTEPFGMDQLDSESLTSDERIYQLLYDLSILEGIPVLGTGTGNQQLALNKAGRLSRLSDPLDGKKQVRLLPGTLNHYMALSPEGQSNALNHCDLSEVMVNGSVSTLYVVDQVANGVEVGGVTAEQPENVIMAASYKGYISTFHFNPEEAFDPWDEKKNGDPNTHIIESFVEFTLAHQRMRKHSLASYFAPAMEQRIERLKHCVSNSKEALDQPEYWFNANKGFVSLNIQPDHTEVTVHIAPGVLRENLDIQQSRDSMIVYLSYPGSESSMELVKSRAEQKVHIEYAQDYKLH
ncbi:hypothetical protein [Endozoicomonas arenosclerae]|uniref:hypothetical protein n=1 Tax=Endozoicomonas arenosclerae TaxID=1633495 RepID=UPI000784D996|nr:hypothetical protein [Endozoicomonas arenosclerae]